MEILFTFSRSLAAEQFRTCQAKASLQHNLSHWLSRKPHLKNYYELPYDLQEEKKYQGIISIPLDEITGSLGRADDFDAQFRPLKKHLRERWVNVALIWQNRGWDAIQVLKVGGEFYVVDGHHRVSVAKALGLSFIDAEVWEQSARLPASEKSIFPESTRWAQNQEECYC